MGLPVFNDCYCLELKWGALIVAIVDLLFAGGVGALAGNSTGEILWYACLAVHVVHIIACILVIVSVFVQNKNFVIVYLITGLIRVIMDICFLIAICCLIEIGHIIFLLVIVVLQILLAVYFWFVIYSWYRMLGGSTPAD
ncbi:hypothetical protein KR054_011840 [Drosophila jambulina]|nr:hypothetical protein KR054_011840 [Drosophila jambulina]